MASPAEAEAAFAELSRRGQRIARVAADLPLRANLSAQENVALGHALRSGTTLQTAMPRALALLQEAGFAEAAGLRDDALDEQARFAVKLARALMSGADTLVIDRPGKMLADSLYPPFLRNVLQRMAGHCGHFWIIDYSWNRPLYAEWADEDGAAGKS